MPRLLSCLLLLSICFLGYQRIDSNELMNKVLGITRKENLTMDKLMSKYAEGRIVDWRARTTKYRKVRESGADKLNRKIKGILAHQQHSLHLMSNRFNSHSITKDNPLEPIENAIGYVVATRFPFRAADLDLIIERLRQVRKKVLKAPYCNPPRKKLF
uniref:Uncharacterized protein n=1 Tax=Haemonchus contortus TaxID=6289 RepID=A0A7I4Y9S2_HAECO